MALLAVSQHYRNILNHIMILYHIATFLPIHSPTLNMLMSVLFPLLNTLAHTCTLQWIYHICRSTQSCVWPVRQYETNSAAVLNHHSKRGKLWRNTRGALPQLAVSKNLSFMLTSWLLFMLRKSWSFRERNSVLCQGWLGPILLTQGLTLFHSSNIHISCKNVCWGLQQHHFWMNNNIMRPLSVVWQHRHGKCP